jgi:hypothetical protein
MADLDKAINSLQLTSDFDKLCLSKSQSPSIDSENSRTSSASAGDNEDVGFFEILGDNDFSSNEDITKELDSVVPRADRPLEASRSRRLSEIFDNKEVPLLGVMKIEVIGAKVGLGATYTRTACRPSFSAGARAPQMPQSRPCPFPGQGVPRRWMRQHREFVQIQVGMQSFRTAVMDSSKPNWNHVCRCIALH